MSHYFIEDLSLADDERELKYNLFDLHFIFKTNRGLFSHTEIDYASALLLTQIPPLSGSLLDMGCGYGFMGIVLAKKYTIALTMSDINPTALMYAKKNIGINTIQAETVLSDGFKSIHDSFDTIITNPPIHAGKETIFTIYEQAREHLLPGGSLFTVVQKKHGAESHLNKIKNIFQNCLILYKRKGYYVIQGKNGG